MSQGGSSTSALVGWVPEDNSRGTWAIITSSLFTIGICTWTAIHPRTHVSRRLRATHKLCQLVKAIIAPEMVCLESIQELIQARKAVRRCAQATNGEFTLLHGFYLGMMGVRYRVGREGYCTLWPGQYAWLLNNGLVSWGEHQAWGLSREDIQDKNKADGLVKLTALLQAFWFTLQSVVRVAHGYPLASIETMTLAYVFNAFVTYGCWWAKPKDIATASFVELPQMTAQQKETFERLSMENTYDVLDPTQSQSLSIAWYVVARDCRDDEVLVMAQRADDEEKGNLDCETARSGYTAQTRVLGTGNEKDSKAKVITEWDANLYMTRYWPLLCLLGASFGAIHLISWNTTFPTTVEQWLWRSSALTSVATAVLCMQFRTMGVKWEGPISIIKVGSPLLYIISRLVMAVETFAGLRAMEPGTYMTYPLMNYWFHFL
ncbi:2e0332dd-2639-4ba2-b789-3678d10ef824 [Thermothielavioides terrestris]|uniref:2e0332dd-2639-4ba2-b789-3678d10ef824 n=1 Tax=Thermothielavioides terrestris TaxID=2587410 RepID=A0A446BEI2_9PEZI|nr:2e0332dd-2639-4ba2-b789-3678d10ef824 [Thermothielavioides terrestris]